MVNNYEYELIDHLICSINTLLNPCHSSRIKGFKQSDVEQLEKAVAVLEKLCFWDFENGEELIGAQTEDKAEPEQVPAEDEDKAEPEEVLAQTDDKFSIYFFYEDGYRVAFPVRDKFYNYGLILHMYSNRFEFSNSELSSSTVLNVFNLDNNIHGDILSICICPTVFDLEYTKPEEVPAEDEDEAEPEKFTCSSYFSHYIDCCPDDVLNPLSEDEIREFNSFVADHNALLIEHEVQSKYKEDPEEVPAEDEDKAEPEQVPAEDEDKAELEEVLSNKKCFSNAHCCTSDCPNIRFSAISNRILGQSEVQQ